MTRAELLRRARAAAARLGPWALRRARERSTWVGLAGVAGALGQTVLADHLTHLAEIVPVLLGTGGAALAAATTSQHPPAPQP